MTLSRRPFIYIASTLRWAERWKALRLAHPEAHFTARWPYLVGEIPDDDPRHAEAFWRDDAYDVQRSDYLLIHANPDDHLRGALVEVGMAISSGLRIVVSGENKGFGSWLHHPSVRAVLLTPAEAVEWIISNHNGEA